jgi:hypothetical protein
MSIDKSEIRIGLANEIGNTLDDALEAAEKEISFFEGGNNALQQVGERVQALAKDVDKDLDEGLIKELEVAALVKRYITRAVGIIGTGARSAENKRLQAEGKTIAFRSSVKAVKKVIDAEQAQLRTIIAHAKQIKELADKANADDVDVDLRRGPGDHPGSSIKTQRLAEELAERACYPPSKPKPKPKPKPRRKKTAKNAPDTG